MGIVSDKESRHLAQRTPYAAAILRLYDNSSLGRRSFEMPLKYFIQGTKSDGFVSNCHGTTAYVTRVEDDIVLYWTPEKFRRLNNDGTEYIALPRVELDRPGFVAPPFMGEFLENGGRFRRITGEPALGDIVTFQDSEQRLQHSAVFWVYLMAAMWFFINMIMGSPSFLTLLRIIKQDWNSIWNWIVISLFGENRFSSKEHRFSVPAGALVADAFHHRAIIFCERLVTDFAFHWYHKMNVPTLTDPELFSSKQFPASCVPDM